MISVDDSVAVRSAIRSSVDNPGQAGEARRALCAAGRRQPTTKTVPGRAGCLLQTSRQFRGEFRHDAKGLPAKDQAVPSAARHRFLYVASVAGAALFSPDQDDALPGLRVLDGVTVVR
jgi:hypothetical protein